MRRPGSSLALKDDFRQTTLSELRDLSIRDINFNTPEHEREEHVTAVIDQPETTRAEDTAPAEDPVLDDFSDHLTANNVGVFKTWSSAPQYTDLEYPPKTVPP